MTQELSFGRREAASGTTKSVVIFLHGYGANGADLLGLADPLAPHMPDTTFLSPDAPENCAGNPGGFQWMGIPHMDGTEMEVALASMAASHAALDAFIDKALQDEEIEADKLILFGFSQGTMMSLHVAPRRAQSVAGVVGFSGRLLMPEKLGDELIVAPPVLLVHGDADDVVPFSDMGEAGTALHDAGFQVYAHVMEGTAHGIAPDGLSVALSFMADKLGIAPPGQ
jgi:phospholipase/carboxylesterase